MRDGIGPDGRHYYPAFPYTSYTGATERDLLDLKAYLFAQPSVAQASRPHEVGFPYSIRSVGTAAVTLSRRWAIAASVTRREISWAGSMPHAGSPGLGSATARAWRLTSRLMSKDLLGGAKAILP
jgi:hypothetical protein